MSFLHQSLRRKYLPEDFISREKLYHGFRKADLDEKDSRLKANSIRFPDFSCNWSRFSKSEDIRKREHGKPTDGCFSFSVENSRYKKMATPCHDPVFRMYAHTEIRQLRLDENIFYQPPKKRKLDKLEHGWSRSQRLEYRMNIVNNLVREIEPAD